MNKTFVLFVLLLLSFSLFSQQISGTWSGSLDIQGTSLRVVFNITKSDTAYTATMDSPDQGAFGLPTTKTSFEDNRLEIVATGLGLFYRGTLEGDSINGTFNQGGMMFPLVLKKSEKPIINRPQTPVEPLPYISEDVTFSVNESNHTIAGTLTLPGDSGIFPAVVLIAGSGRNDRDETVYGHKPFFVISDHLTRNGFAVLRYDKRGVGESTGNYATATISSFADDAKAAVEYLKSRKEIENSKIGLIGHSEGGIVAPIVASANKDISFIVLMAAPGIKGIEIVLDQNETSMRFQNMEPETIDRMQKTNREMFEKLLEWDNSESHKTTLRDNLLQLWDQIPILIKLKADKDAFLRSQYNTMVSPGYRSFLISNPELYLHKVRCPVFAINGVNDTQILAEKNLNAIKNNIEKGGNNKVDIKPYPNLNHLFQGSITGQVDEYAKIEETFSIKVLEDITNWLKKHSE